MQSVLARVALRVQLGLVHVLQSQLILLLASFCPLLLVKVRYLDQRFLPSNDPFLQGQSVFTIVLMQVNAHFRQRFFSIFETETIFDAL